MSPAEPLEPGARFLDEIREQPAALRRLLEHDTEIARIAGTMRDRGTRLVRMVGHGSSDNAASYGVYAFGLLPNWTAMRDSITLTVHYGRPLDMTGLDRHRPLPIRPHPRCRRVREGCATRRSVHDRRHERPDVGAGDGGRGDDPARGGARARRRRDEDVRNTLASLALLAGHVAGRGRELADGVRGAAELMEAAIPGLERSTAKLALPFSYTGRMFVIGRGVEFATAREIALKLLETCRIAAEPLTTTDLAHGPVAALDPLFPVWAIASRRRHAADRSGGGDTDA